MTLLAEINWHSFFFLLFALGACLFAILVLVTSNIVRMAFYLTIALGFTAGLFMLAGAHFVGAMQLMIYVGGTLVLLVFGVMLTAQESFVSMKTRAGEWILAAVVGGSLFLILVQAAMSIPEWRSSQVARDQPRPTEAHTTTQLGLALMSARVDKWEQPDARLESGMSGYLLPFEIISVHLLVVLIGAAYLARAKRRVPSKESN